MKNVQSFCSAHPLDNSSILSPIFLCIFPTDTLFLTSLTASFLYLALHSFLFSISAKSFTSTQMLCWCCFINLSLRYKNNYHGQMYCRSESLSKFFSFLIRVHEEWVFGMGGGSVWWIRGWRGGLLGETVIGSRCKLVRVRVEVKWGRRGEGKLQKNSQA